MIAEARKNGVRLILSLVNNLQAYGGKTQYVKWAWQEGIGISSSNDSFFYDPSIQTYFKSYIKVLFLSFSFWELNKSRCILIRQMYVDVLKVLFLVTTNVSNEGSMYQFLIDWCNNI